MKKCPFCAEEIHDEAVKCKHCREFLNKEIKPPLATKTEDEITKNITRRIFITPFFMTLTFIGIIGVVIAVIRGVGMMLEVYPTPRDWAHYGLPLNSPIVAGVMVAFGQGGALVWLILAIIGFFGTRKNRGNG